MLKRVVLAIFCVLALLSACEPSGSESMEPVPKGETGAALGDGSAPLQNPPTKLDSIATLALAEVNAWREKGCTCGNEPMPATTPLTWNTKLYNAALAHASDMQTTGYFGHTSPSGENVYHRLTQSGYINNGNVLTYGENIAFGGFDVKSAIKKWLESPSHCANMMRTTYREMAIAHDGNYWVQVFGTLRE